MQEGILIINKSFKDPRVCLKKRKTKRKPGICVIADAGADGQNLKQAAGTAHGFSAPFRYMLSSSAVPAAVRNTRSRKLSITERS